MSKSLRKFQVLLLCTTLITLGTLAYSLVVIGEGPVVVVQKEERQEFFIGSREAINLGPENIKAFTNDFLKARYNWEEFNPKKIIERVSCVSTKRFRRNLLKTLGKRSHKNRKKESIGQYLGEIKVDLKNEKIQASVDRIIRINKIPLITRESIDLYVIEDKKTVCNPLGLYVNKVIEGDQFQVKVRK